jgi:hypothetical protein
VHIFFKKYKFQLILPGLAILILLACSTEKNTFINRTYHSTTARYNGYFNAKELLRIGFRDYRRTYREDFYNILPIDLLPNEDDVVDMFPILDTAIAKCTKVISKHSMPTASKPAKKKAEYANWIDENWVLIGKANFYKRDYQKALENFEFVRKFYSNRPTTYVGLLWKAKCQIELGDIPSAQRTLQILDNNYNSYLSDRKSGGSKKDKKSGDNMPEFPKYLHVEIAKTKAHIALINNEQDQAINFLKQAIKKSKDKEEKARLNFIVGQLMQAKGDESASKYYAACMKYNPPFEMGFHARINKATSSNASPDDVIADLKKMGKEQKYLEYRDQIYFAMSTIELGRDGIAAAKTYLTLSARYSLDNVRQKGISYERLGDLAFGERNYVSAQRYYDSSSQVIPDEYVNADLIRSKAANLAKLVENIDVVHFEDSVQRIAQLPEKEREKFLKDVVKKLQEEERLRKEREAERAEEMRKLQQQLAAQSQGDGLRSYWNNPKMINEGKEEFSRIWGQRENEDDWRRSNKMPSAEFSELPEDDTLLVENQKPTKTAIEEMTWEDLLVNIPLTDSAMEVSNERLMAALYNSGMIYVQQLKEPQMGGEQFQRVLDKRLENEHNILSAFELYKIHEGNAGKQGIYRDYILNKYPKSDYANFLRDPDYFIKKKEMDALALDEYLKSVERFERGIYYPVILKADNVISGEPDNKYRAEYFILKAMAMGKINADKSSLIPVLEQAIAEYPGTPSADRAEELLGFIKNGIPAFEEFSVIVTSDLYKYNSKDKYFVIVMLDAEDNAREAQTKISDFNREFFSRDRLKTGSQILDAKNTLIVVREFKSAADAREYIKNFERTKKHVQAYKSKKILFVSADNFKTLVKEKDLIVYEKFFLDTY